MPDPAVMKGVLRHFCRTESRRVYDLLGDSELLARFLSERDELAFEQIVMRHGPMVRAVCRRKLGPTADADDAFQATFLVLVRKARSIRRSSLLANWLCAVAYRTARQALRRRIRLGARERIVEQLPEAAWTDEPPRDWLPLFDAALQRLPSKYREPVVLCELQGVPRPAAARKLGLNEGTLSSRLGRARDLLRKRLGSCGFPLAIGASLAPLTVPESLLASTVAASLNVGAASVTAVVLTEGVVTAMFASKLKAGVACAAVLFVGAFAGVQLSGPTSQAGPPGKEATVAKEESKAPTPKQTANNPIATETKPAKLAAEYEPFQGTWDVISAAKGSATGPDAVGVDADWKFDGTTLMTGSDAKDDSAEKFVVDARAKPATIDFILTQFTSDGSGRMVRTPYQGIFRFEADGALTICYRVKLEDVLRPTRFATARNSGATLLVLRRPQQAVAKADLPPIHPMPFVDSGTVPPNVPAIGPVPIALDFGFPVPSIPPPSVDLPPISPPLADDRLAVPASRNPELASPPPTASDLDRLQGSWEIANLDGRPPTGPDRRDVNLEFLKDRVLTSEGSHGRVILDEKKSPKQISLTMAKQDEEPIHGIYKLEGDTLTISMHNKTAKLIPTTFEPDPDLGISVIVFQRQKEVRPPKSTPQSHPRVETSPRIEKAPALQSERDLLKELDQLRDRIKKLEKELKEPKPGIPGNPLPGAPGFPVVPGVPGGQN